MSDCPTPSARWMSGSDSDSDCPTQAMSGSDSDSSMSDSSSIMDEWDYASLDLGAGCPAEVENCYSSRPRLETDWEFGSSDIMTTGPPRMFQPSQIPFSSAPHSYKFNPAPVNVTTASICTCEYDSQEQLQRKAAELHENAAALEAAAQHMRAAVKCMRQGQQDSNPSATPRQLCLSSLVENPPCNAAQTIIVPSSKPSDEKAMDAESRTTVLLRRLPANFTRSDLLEVLDSEGFKDCYDFVYMPVDFVKWSSFGYAFINLASHKEALRMWHHFDGFTAWPSHGDAKGRACEVAWSKPLQGLSALVERYRNSPVMHEDMPDHIKPVVFSSGQKVKFPSPTEDIVPVSKCRSLGQR